jgi:acyl-CoA dehydrogenase
MATTSPAPSFSLALSEDQATLRGWLHGFAAEVIRPAAEEWDEREAVPWPIIAEAARLGIYGQDMMQQFVDDPTGLLLAIYGEELFWGDAGIAMSFAGTLLPVFSIIGMGTPEQISEWLPQCFGDESDPKLAAFCSSEPDAGSDVSAIRTVARYDAARDEWVLNGQKAWATNGGIASVHVVVASVDRQLGSRGQAAFVVPAGTPGLSQGAKYRKHGIRASHTAEVNLDDCRVPGRLVLGGKDALDTRLALAREGRSARGSASMAAFERTRPAIGSQAVGVARAAHEYALQYAAERVQFGRPLIDNQAISFRLADQRIHIDAARLLVWKACWMAASGQRYTAGEGSQAKVFASEVAVRVTEEAIQILGGYGYTREFPVERWARDAKIYPIWEGTSEIQRLVIARAITGRRLR